jgi:adenosylcobinamide kinase/adenosylcobinamide-phosphate guanylyltransferase
MTAQHPSEPSGLSRSALVLVIGGARSGKSRYAETLAASAGKPVTYIATAGPPRDAEMAARIEKHRADRPADWTTVEVTHALDGPLREASGVVLVDCLTLWLTNLVLAERDVDAATDGLIAALDARRAAVVAVSNEVGEGIVPETALGRSFRDKQGVLNQRVARAADTVVKMAAGYPLIVKPNSQPEPTL